MKIAEQEFQLKNGKMVLIRESREEDAFDFIRHAKLVRSETEFLLTSPDEIPDDIEKQKQFIQMMRESENTILLVALDGDRIIASLGVTSVIEKMKTKHRASFGISIGKEYWAEGLGEKLSQIAITFAQKYYKQIELGVYEENDRARKLYQKLGFEEWGKVPRAYCLKDGTFQNEIIMGLFL